MQNLLGMAQLFFCFQPPLSARPLLAMPGSRTPAKAEVPATTGGTALPGENCSIIRVNPIPRVHRQNHFRERGAIFVWLVPLVEPPVLGHARGWPVLRNIC